MDLITPQKEDVREFWNADPCGTRYLEGKEDFEAHARARYSLEPFIFDFAKFDRSRGLRILEVGIGMGADYLEWLKAGARATGVDLSAASVERTRQRCQQAGYEPDLRIADAEQLPFPDDSFDVVYSYGVMHHSPNTEQCVREAWRVLKPGGIARIMIYHHPSITGAMLWLRYGFLRGKSLRQSGKPRHKILHTLRSTCDVQIIHKSEHTVGFQPWRPAAASTIRTLSVRPLQAGLENVPAWPSPQIRSAVGTVPLDLRRKTCLTPLRIDR